MHKNRGQSISEFIVTMAVLVPFLLLIATFSNLLNVSHEAAEAGRFAAWERTVYQTSETFNFTEENLTDRLKKNLKEVYLSREYIDFGPGKDLTSSTIPSLVDTSAEFGLSTPSNLVGALGDIHNKDTDLAANLGFSSNAASIVSPRVSLPLNEDMSIVKLMKQLNYRQSTYIDGTVPEDTIAQDQRYNISSHSALLASGWSPVGADQFFKNTSEAAFDGKALKRFESGNMLMSFLKFREAKFARTEDGLSTTAPDQQDILPADLLQFPE